jgi:hypothetical protein
LAPEHFSLRLPQKFTPIGLRKLESTVPIASV